MKDPTYLKYVCSRCGHEIKDTEEVLIIEIFEKDPIDLCEKCSQDFKDFMKGKKYENS